MKNTKAAQLSTTMTLTCELWCLDNLTKVLEFKCHVKAQLQSYGKMSTTIGTSVIRTMSNINANYH